MPELKPELDHVVNSFDPWARDRGKYYTLAWEAAAGRGIRRRVRAGALSAGRRCAPAPHPAETGRRPARRPVFAADPAVEAQLVDDAEQVRIVQLALVGLVALRHAGDLQVADASGRQVLRSFIATSPSTIWQW